MLQQMISKGDSENMKKLFKTYSQLNDEEEIVNISGKLIQKSVDCTKEELIEIFDKIYEIINKPRKAFHYISELEQVELNKGNKKHATYLSDYKHKISVKLAMTLKKFLRDLKKSVDIINEQDDKEKLIFLTLNLADYYRYLSEITLDPGTKKEHIKECQKIYEQLFGTLERLNVSKVNPTNITAYYHFAIFLYEVKEEKAEAVKTLKTKHQEIVDNLEYAYKYYIDSYELLEIVTESLTNWVVNLNTADNQKMDDDEEDEYSKPEKDHDENKENIPIDEK